MTALTPVAASVLYLPNALTPQRRELRQVRRACVRAFDPHWQTPYIAILDGAPLLRRDWDWMLQPGQTLAFVDVRAIPQGGGGGGSDPMRMVAMMALTYFTMGAGAGWLVGQWSVTGLAAGSFAGFAAQTAAYLVGSSVINAVLPPQQAQRGAASYGSGPSASPTYNLNAQGNMGRIGAAIPEHFGRLMAYPDLAALPYQEYRGNEQYLYQLLCIGRGSYDIEAIRIEDTPIASFDDITYEVVPPNGAVTLFPTAVVTATEVSGQTLDCTAGTYSQSGTTVTVTLQNHGLSIGSEAYLNYTSGSAVDGSFPVVSAPTADTFTVTAAASLTTSGNVEVSPWVGGFALTDAAVSSTNIGVDCVLPRGLFATDANGNLTTLSLSVQVQARTVDDNGLPVGNWATLGTETWSAATATPQRYSARYAVAAARYQVRARRVDVKNTASSVGHDVVWGSLRGYLPDARTYGDVTLLAMVMRASNNLSAMASRKVNVICTRKLPVWNGSTWSAATATRSPAWAIAYAAKQIGLTDAQIDLAGLFALATTWQGRGDNFDGRFDNFSSFMESVAKIAQAGRAKPFMQGGILRLVRDQAATLPVQLYSQRNIRQGSFAIDYLMPTPDTADAIDVSYTDAAVWKPRRVRAAVPGSTAAKPVSIDLFGVTDRGQAYREGLYQAACNRYRRRMIRFETEMEGFIPSLGDLIAVQHDLPAWGQGGEVTGWNAATRTLTLSEPLTWTAGQTHYIGLRTAGGGVDGPYVATAGAQANQAVLASEPASTPYTGQMRERTHFAFGWGESWRQTARVLSVKPSGMHGVVIEAVAEDSNVHTIDQGVTVPSPATSQLANYSTAPRVDGLLLRSLPGTSNRVLATWQPSQWAEYYIVEQSVDASRWERMGEPRTATFTFTALYGAATRIRVAAVGVARGPWREALFGSSADYMWISDANLMWNATPTTKMWKY